MRSLPVLVAVAMLTTVATVREARACSGFCFPARLLPSGQGATVPANAGALPFYLGGRLAAAPSDAGAEVPTLRDGAGNVVPTSVEALPEGSLRRSGFERVVRWSSELAPGPYTFEVPSPCATSFSAKASFTVVPAAPPPAKLGTVTATSARGLVLAEERAASCVANIDAAQAKLSLVPDPSFAPFAAVALYEVEVDGALWRGSVVDYGPGRLGPPSAFDAFTLIADCRPSSVGDSVTVLPEGDHDVTVRARLPALAGVPELSTTTRVSLSCASASSGAASSGAPSSGASSSDSGGEGGCRMSPGSGSGAGGFAGALGLAAALATTLRRARRTSARPS